MTKIFISEINNKFFNNIKYLLENDIHVYSGSPVNIYKIHHEINANIYIFDSSHLNNEIIQFINEHSDIFIKTFVYHHKSNINKDSIRYLKKVKHIISSDIFEEFKIYHNAVPIPKYITNPKIFFNVNKNCNDRCDRIVYFLDNYNAIPENISINLYPINKNSKILLFNNSLIQHPQNLGLVNEFDKAKLLNKYKYLLCDNNSDYEAEALVCGCRLVDTNLNEKILSEELSIKTYQEFIRNLL